MKFVLAADSRMSYHYTVNPDGLESNFPDKGNETAIESDAELVRAILAGSIAAWHKFIDRYSGLIFGVIRRRLVMEDEDAIRTVYVDILKSLYDGKLKNYRGEARLSTWLTVFTRGRALDYFRRRHGRRSGPKEHTALTELDREIIRLFYADRMPLEVIVQILRAKGHSIEADGIVEAIQRLDGLLDKRYLKRLDYERHAKARGIDSARMLEYLIGLERDLDDRNDRDRPDTRLIEAEIREAAERIRTQVSLLPPDERKLIFLRFTRGWSAWRISDKLGLGGRRRVYTMIDGVLRKLRKNSTPGEE